ncbi:MAG: double zinc ribbon domain-containing protein [Candidatus Promineifilaceae bacterium]
MTFPSLDTIVAYATICIAGLGALLAALWISLIIWTFRDMRSRSRDPFAQLLAAVMVALLPGVGLVVYLILRPSESLAEAYERALEEEALLQEIEERPACPGCSRTVEPRWLLCPHCHTRLRKACPDCDSLMELHWNLCPYCGSNVIDPYQVAPAARLGPATSPSAAISEPAERPGAQLGPGTDGAEAAVPWYVRDVGRADSAATDSPLALDEGDTSEAEVAVDLPAELEPLVEGGPAYEEWQEEAAGAQAEADWRPDVEAAPVIEDWAQEEAAATVAEEWRLLAEDAPAEDEHARFDETTAIAAAEAAPLEEEQESQAEGAPAEDEDARFDETAAIGADEELIALDETPESAMGYYPEAEPGPADDAAAGWFHSDAKLWQKAAEPEAEEPKEVEEGYRPNGDEE